MINCSHCCNDEGNLPCRYCGRPYEDIDALIYVASTNGISINRIEFVLHEDKTIYGRMWLAGENNLRGIISFSRVSSIRDLAVLLPVFREEIAKCERNPVDESELEM